jgi:formate/nitrite transporter FocA (FNT family)
VARGILCNALVCLAVWLCLSGQSVTDKIIAILQNFLANLVSVTTGNIFGGGFMVAPVYWFVYRRPRKAAE